MSTLTASKLQPAPAPARRADPVIQFEDVSVLYRVPRERVSGIKEFTIRWLQRRLAYEEFWGLRSISFSIERGEVFGVIGRNGAGKSTMLKVMARVLIPKHGRVVMRGKVAPLLELGAGFHPELTGRENIYLNSALLGYTRKQVVALLPSIIDFAEVGDFIDAPLRTYSTGMIARLGFAVATCQRPDILLVDEVLSVGDSRFQDKCLARMNSFQEQGTTTVIVSHSMETIQNFCTRALWLDHGQAGAIGVVAEVIQAYTS
jgi:ABC-type polysaccharide/polyol phosphate transport system ATPase subunit